MRSVHLPELSWPGLFMAGFFCIPMLADQIRLTNGDVITGAIIRKGGDTLTLKSTFLGEVTMPWSAVAALTSEDALTVVTAAGASVNGRLTTQSADLIVTGQGTTETTPLS